MLDRHRPFPAAALGLSLALAVPAGAETLREGVFSGQSDHVTTGGVSIERDGDTTVLVLGPDFSLDGAPDPTLGFSSGGEFDLSTEFADLRSKAGEQRYELPASIDVEGYDAVTVWCSEFAVPLGSAPLD